MDTIALELEFWVTPIVTENTIYALYVHRELLHAISMVMDARKSVTALAEMSYAMIVLKFLPTILHSVSLDSIADQMASWEILIVMEFLMVRL